ncbi:MAG TPA: helix-turn-helix domain-containing protein [Desulfobulbus sp.]|nr:helix-turn-helix domain-containing protein [Desulfobulbus sp.]
MPEPTKKRHTEIELKFVGPGSRKKAAINALHKLGFVHHEEDPAVEPWRTFFPELKENEQGAYLSGARHREGLTQRQLAEQTGIRQHHISEMENGKRSIGKKNAKVLAGALNTDYRIFL